MVFSKSEPGYEQNICNLFHWDFLCSFIEDSSWSFFLLRGCCFSLLDQGHWDLLPGHDHIQDAPQNLLHSGLWQNVSNIRRTCHYCDGNVYIYLHHNIPRVGSSFEAAPWAGPFRQVVSQYLPRQGRTFFIKKSNIRVQKMRHFSEEPKWGLWKLPTFCGNFRHH